MSPAKDGSKVSIIARVTKADGQSFRINRYSTIEGIEMRAPTFALGTLLFVVGVASMPAQSPAAPPDFAGVYYPYNRDVVVEPGRVGHRQALNVVSPPPATAQQGGTAQRVVRRHANTIGRSL
jgi:hypothetical protein